MTWNLKGLATVDTCFKNLTTDNTLGVLLKMRWKYFRVPFIFRILQAKNDIKAFIPESAQRVI